MEERPWGEFFILSEDQNFKIKKILVKPNKRLSYQYHKNRDELWYFINGQGKVTVNEKFSIVEKGSIVTINRLDKHRIENIGNENLIFIEVQTGSYFGEDDIVRIQDDFNRK